MSDLLPEPPEGVEFREHWEAAKYANDDVYIASEDLRAILERLEYWKARTKAQWAIGDLEFNQLILLRHELTEARRGL